MPTIGNPDWPVDEVPDQVRPRSVVVTICGRGIPATVAVTPTYRNDDRFAELGAAIAVIRAPVSNGRPTTGWVTEYAIVQLHPASSERAI